MPASAPSRPARPLVRRVLLALGGLLLAAAGGGGGAWWWVNARPVDPACVDTVSEDALARALAPDPAMPLSHSDTSVLLIAVCTLRQDRLQPYGQPEPTSPWMEALAEAGVTFEHNIAQAPWTRPSMGTIVTGRWPRALGLDALKQGRHVNGVIDDAETTLAERLKAAGYATGGVVANPNMKEIFGFRQGYDLYREPSGRYKERPVLDGAADIVDHALEMADALPSDQPILLAVTTIDTHKTRRFPGRYLRLFRSGRAEIDNYDAAVRHIDAQFARLQVELSKKRPNLLVILSADHGEGLRLPRHHGPEHGSHVWRTTVETPLIVQHPSLPRGRRVGGLSMNLDIVPTVLELLGLPAEGPLDGQSLAPAIRGATDRAPHASAFSETFFKKVHKSTVITPDYQLVRKYTQNKDDPNEHVDNLYTFADWQGLDPVQAKRPDAFRAETITLDAWEDEMAGIEPARGKGKKVVLDAATEAQLAKLGYLDDNDDDDE